MAPKKLLSVKDLVSNSKTFSIDRNLKISLARNIVDKSLKELNDKYESLKSKTSKRLIESSKKRIVDKFQEIYGEPFYKTSYPIVEVKRRRLPFNNLGEKKSNLPSPPLKFQLKPDFFSPTQPSVKLPQSFVQREMVVNNMKLDFYTPWARPRMVQPGKSTRETIKRELVTEPTQLIETKEPIKESVKIERLEQPIESPINASAPPLDINSTPRLSAKNKGLRLAARKRLFLNKYGDALNSGFDNGLGLGVLGGLGYLLTKVLNPEYRLEIIARSRYNNTNLEGTPSNNQSDSTLSSTQNTSLTNTSNTSLTNTTPAQNNTSNASLTNTSTLKNTSRTTQANTSNRNTQATSNRLSLSKSRKTSSNKSNTASRKKLISKAQVKKAFADEFKKAYQNATIDVGNSSTRDYYSEALDLKSQLDKQRKDEVAKLLLQVLSLLSQLNQLTNPIY